MNLFLHTYIWCIITCTYVDYRGALKDHLREEFDYIFLPEDGWVYMVQNYGTLHGRKVSLH